MLILLTGCETVPTAPPPPPAVQCPRLPVLEPSGVPERDWLGQMRDFLRGTLPTPPDYRLPSSGVKLHTAKP
jgi:hypothetical protein